MDFQQHAAADKMNTTGLIHYSRVRYTDVFLRLVRYMDNFRFLSIDLLVV